MNDSSQSKWFVIRKAKAVAYGKPVQDGFLVRAGSTTLLNSTAVEKRDRPMREQLRQSGVLVADNDPSLLRFTKDHVFTTPSRAGGIVIDANCSGNEAWKDEETGKSLREWLETEPQDQISDVSLSRAAVEAAMDRYDELGEDSFRSAYPQFGDARDYWVRSSCAQQRGPYPTKPIAALAAGLEQLNGGWSTRNSAASLLHNAGFIIVGRDNTPVEVPKDKPHLLRGADQIRACAIVYYIDPARERGDQSVSITAGKLHKEIGLSKNWANVCQALEGQIFQRQANVLPPTRLGAERSPKTTFTFELEPKMAATNKPAAIATNLILYGPPGTGKTYATAWEAVRLCIGEPAATPLQGADKRDALMAEYRRLVSEGRIEFVTFHQSMSYEEFIEGLRPYTGEADGEEPEEAKNSAGFRLEPHDGVFKRVSERARLDRGNEGNSVRLDRSAQVFKVALGQRQINDDWICYGLDNGLIHVGWGGDLDWSDERFNEFGEICSEWRSKKDPEATSHDGNIVITFSFRSDMQIGDYVAISDGRDRIRAFGKVIGEYFFDRQAAFHPHRRQVEWLWRDDAGAERSRFYPNGFRRHSVYKLNQSLVDWDALEAIVFGENSLRGGQSSRAYVLIIDEINRANISKVFGELITLLEPDKRLGAANEIRLQLPYSKKPFGVPANLHIIGTMNTADRSIALLDTALRRRFSFRELMPNPSILSTNIDGINLKKLLTTINERIEYLFDRDHQIGHAYFTGCTTRDEIEEVMRHKIVPLLSEYFYDDWAKIAIVLNDAPNGSGDGKFLQRERLVLNGVENSDGESSERLRWTAKKSFDFSEFAAG